MSFESVYRVSSRCSIPDEEELNSLSQSLGMELPLGYREYVTTLGLGALCCYIAVRMPNQIGTPTAKSEEYYRMLFAIAGENASFYDYPEDLDESDYETATAFAYAIAERPIWFSTPSQGSRLFEHVDCEVNEIRNGVLGLVERCPEMQSHEFPFFEPNNGRRRMRQLYVRPGIGRAGIVEALTRRWGRDGFLCSRSSAEELYPVYFLPAVEGQMELHLDPNVREAPDDRFFVRASYDIDSEQEFAAFIEPLLLPGGGPYEKVGKPFWLP